MEFHDYPSKADRRYERAMELVFIQVDSVQDELEQLALLVDEIQNDDLREKIDKLVLKAMSSLDKI